MVKLLCFVPCCLIHHIGLGTNKNISSCFQQGVFFCHEWKLRASPPQILLSLIERTDVTLVTHLLKVSNNSGTVFPEFQCQVVCLRVIHVCGDVCGAAAPTSGTSVIGVVSPQAFSSLIDDTYHNLSAGTLPANQQPALLCHHPQFLVEREMERWQGQREWLIAFYEYKNAYSVVLSAA